MKIIKETNIGEDSNAQILTFKEAQIDEDEYFEMKIKNDLRPILRFLRDKYAERSEGSRQLEEIEKYVQQLIREVATVQPNIVVVLANSDAVVMPWLSECKALLETFFAGQGMGRAAPGNRRAARLVRRRRHSLVSAIR